ncbi:MAG TPA: hypothetical protein VGX76_03575 [Pirellulales bacterium]|nr:hypothetical protein [Pirellulales bacterium]
MDRSLNDDWQSLNEHGLYTTRRKRCQGDPVVSNEMNYAARKDVTTVALLYDRRM